MVSMEDKWLKLLWLIRKSYLWKIFSLMCLVIYLSGLSIDMKINIYFEATLCIMATAEILIVMYDSAFNGIILEQWCVSDYLFKPNNCFNTINIVLPVDCMKYIRSQFFELFQCLFSNAANFIVVRLIIRFLLLTWTCRNLIVFMVYYCGRAWFIQHNIFWCFRSFIAK